MTDDELIAAFRSAGPKMPAGVPMPRDVIAGLRAVMQAVNTETYRTVNLGPYAVRNERRAAWVDGAQWAARRWTGHEVDPRDYDPILDQLFPDPVSARTDSGMGDSK